MFECFGKKRIRQNYFGLKIVNYLTNLRFIDIIEVIDENIEKLGNTPEEGYRPFLDGIVRTYKDGDLYVLYYDSVRIVINNGKDKLLKVSILGQGGSWKIWELDAKGKNMHTIDSPDSESYTVYTYCDIMMPTGKMMCDERYTKGTWNEYVYKAVIIIVDFVNSFKEKNKFNNYYKY